MAHSIKRPAGSKEHSLHGWMSVSDWTAPEILKSELAPELSDYQHRLRTLTYRIKKYRAVPVYVTPRRGDYRFMDRALEVLVQSGQVKDDFEPSDQALVEMSLVNEVALSVCREMRLLYVDLDGDVDLNAGNFDDALHARPSGPAKVADSLFNWL